MKPRLNSLASLKRFLSTKPTLGLVTYKVRGEPANHKFLGIPRQVVHAGSKDFALGNPDNAATWSYMSWPKAHELTTIEAYDGEGVHAPLFTNAFKIETGCLSLTYKIHH